MSFDVPKTIGNGGRALEWPRVSSNPLGWECKNEELFRGSGFDRTMHLGILCWLFGNEIA